MKTRLLSLVFAVLCFSLPVQSQILNEIRSFVDSTEIILDNGRKMLYQNLAAGDYEKAAEVYQFLKTEAAGNHCFALNYNEDLYVNLLLNNWEDWLDNAANYNDIIKLSACYNYSENYVERLYSLTIKNLDTIEAGLTGKDFQGDEWNLIRLYLYLLKNKVDDGLYKTHYKTFLKNYPNSVYTGFVKGYFPKPPTKGAFAMSVGPTFMMPQGNLAEVVKSGVLFNYTMDLNIGKMYCGFHLDGGSLELKTPVSFSNESGVVVQNFSKGDKFSLIGGGIYAGYYFVRSRNIQIAPYVNIGGYTLESKLYPGDEPEYEVFNSFVVGPGLHTEFKIKEFSLDPYYGAMPEMEASSYVSLKIDIGYDIRTKKVNPDFMGNLPYVRMGLVWGVGNF